MTVASISKRHTPHLHGEGGGSSCTGTCEDMAARVGRNPDTVHDRDARCQRLQQDGRGNGMAAAATAKVPYHRLAVVAFVTSIVALVLAFYGSLYAEKHIAGSPLRQA